MKVRLATPGSLILPSTISLSRSLVITQPWCHHNINNQLILLFCITRVLSTMSWPTFYNHLKDKPHSFSIIRYKTITVKLSTEIAVIETILVRWFGWLEETNDRNVCRERSRFTGSGSTVHSPHQIYPSLNLTYSICGRKPKELLNYIGITEGVRGKQTIILNWVPSCISEYKTGVSAFPSLPASLSRVWLQKIWSDSII